MKRPITYRIYKGKGGKQGCFQFSLQPAYTGKKKAEGTIFIEAAAATAPDIYDWQNKTIFALSVSDIGELLAGFRQGKVELYHDPDAGTDRRNTRSKRLTLNAGKNPGTFFLQMTEKNGENTKTVKIALQPNEVCILITLLEAALPRILAW